MTSASRVGDLPVASPSSGPTSGGRFLREAIDLSLREAIDLSVMLRTEVCAAQASLAVVQSLEGLLDLPVIMRVSWEVEDAIRRLIAVGDAHEADRGAADDTRAHSALERRISEGPVEAGAPAPPKVSPSKEPPKLGDSGPPPEDPSRGPFTLPAG